MVILCKKCSNITNKIYEKFTASESQLNINYSNYKSKCKSKNWIFNLKKKKIKNLVFNNCHYRNQEPP